MAYRRTARKTTRSRTRAPARRGRVARRTKSSSGRRSNVRSGGTIRLVIEQPGASAVQRPFNLATNEAVLKSPKAKF